MNKESLKNEPGDKNDIEKETTDVSENNYRNYLKLGGIINEKDYQSAVTRLQHTTTIDKTLTMQAEAIAQKSGITLHNLKDSFDPITILYGILRSDQFEPKDPKKNTITVK